jgi:hypothetical protein
MQNVPGEVEHCLGRNSRDNSKEEGVSRPIPTDFEQDVNCQWIVEGRLCCLSTNRCGYAGQL